MPQIKDICNYLEEWAPRPYAENYDNVGLLVGDYNADVSGVLVSLDCTEAIVDEAIEKGCNLIVSHHPILFKGLKKLIGSNYVERTIVKAIKNDIALYAIHTNLDNVQDGVNAKIADIIGLSNPRILRPNGETLQKLTVFIPNAEAENLRSALFSSGAGVIGNYSNCSFNLEGKGTFKALEDANPAVGEIGETHTESETRIEVMFPSILKNRVLTAMKEAHPYEEVAYYLHSLDNTNQYLGSGMVGVLENPIPTKEFMNQLKEKMGLPIIRHTNLVKKEVKTIAICGGSGSFLLNDAKRSGADVFITGDFKYHEFFDAENDIVIADIGHFESERFTIDLIAENLLKKFTTFAVRLTEVNTNPIHYF